MIKYPTKEQVEQLRKEYPLGTRICVDKDTDTEQRVPPGTLGSVIKVTDDGTVHCVYDNGVHLGLIWGVDAYHKLDAPLDPRALLEEKVESCYAAYRAELLTKSPEELVDMAESIRLMNLTKELLIKSIPAMCTAALLQFKDPLQVVCDCWKETYFEDEYQMRSEIFVGVANFMESSDAGQRYEMEQPEEADCSEEPGMNM